MTTATEANAYLRTQVLTASPQQLRLMLLDGSIRFLQQAIDGLGNKDYEASYNGITQARAIVLELATSVSPDVDRELAERVRSVYMYLYRELIDASLNRSLPRLEKAADLLRYERETWAMLMEKVATERVANTADTPADTAHSPEPTGFSAQG
ncbi:MAG: flagellar export chaperone FliS [Planctomycetota bacterium]|nr:MAG: flagellar export chaperone FliS [Planctomycetota bacterium]